MPFVRQLNGDYRSQAPNKQQGITLCHDMDRRGKWAMPVLIYEAKNPILDI